MIKQSGKFKLKRVKFQYKLGRFWDRFSKTKGLNDRELTMALHYECEPVESAFDYMLKLHGKKRCSSCEGKGFD